MCVFRIYVFLCTPLCGGGVSACSCLYEQTPDLTQIHPHNLQISLDKPSRTADSWDVLTGPNAGKLLPSWVKTLRIPSSSLTASVQSADSLQGPQRTVAPTRSRILLVQSADMPHGANLMQREGTCANINCLCDLHMLSVTHTNLLYTQGKPGTIMLWQISLIFNLSKSFLIDFKEEMCKEET